MEKSSSNQLKDVIIVDDDPASAFLTEEMLKDYFTDLNILKFGTGQDCLQFLKDKKEETVILLDINMPEMNGWEFVRYYRDFGFKDQIVLLTSSINEDDRKRAEREKIHFLNKPLEPAILEDLI